MAQLKQPSASVNAQTPLNSAPKPDTGQPARSGALATVAILAALAVAAGTFVYYEGERGTGTDVTSSMPATTSDNSASAPVAITTPSTEAQSSAPSATMATKANDESSVQATANTAPPAHANSAKPRSVTKASKPTRALEPRDRPIALVNIPHPQYPVQALRTGEQGTVRVLAQVNIDGKVTDARVVGRSGSSILDAAAPKEVRSWKFDPAVRNGHPVVASIEVPVNYRLNQ
jgi:TonB family protein